MRIFEFLIRLFTRFAPVDKETISTLSFQLQEWHTNHTQDFKEKMEHNLKIADKAAELKKKLDATEAGTPEYETLLFDFTELAKQRSEPTLTEKALDFLDKPLVKLSLMVIFIFVSRYIMKKLTGADKDDLEEEEIEPNTKGARPAENFYQQQQPQYWQPQPPPFYGHGYQPQYPQQPPQGR